MNFDASIRRVAQGVIDRIGVPHDSYEIAAQLEVQGVRDLDARNDFGCGDVFDLARRSFALFERGELTLRVEPDDTTPRGNELLLFLRDYASSLVFSLPMLLQGVTLLFAGYGLWGGSELDIRSATAIALGFIASYVTTGGLSQAIVRRGLYYRYQEEGALAQWTVWRIWRVSLRLALLLTIPAVLLNALLHLLPWDMVAIALLYYVALTVLWLNWAVAYLVERSWTFLAALVVATGVVLLCGRVFDFPVIAANMVGLVVANVLTLLVGVQGLRRWADVARGTTIVNPPRLAVVLYGTSKVFLYGLLYSAFIFADRVVAWTTDRGREDFPPYGFWLSARYELGMDFALIVVVLLGGIVEYSTRRFSERLVPEQKQVKAAALAPFFIAFRAADGRQMVALLSCAIVAVSIAAAVFFAARGVPYPTLHASLVSTTTTRVFIVAAFSYAVFMIAVQNILLLLTLSRTDTAVRLLGIALVVNVAVGFVASRSIHYSAAIAGLLVGSVTLLVLSRRRLREVLSDLDYYYYAAF